LVKNHFYRNDSFNHYSIIENYLFHRTVLLTKIYRVFENILAT